VKEIDVLCCGLLTADFAFSLQKLPEKDEKVFADSFEIRTGGPAANAALTVKLLGGKAELIAVTDNSIAATGLLNQLEQGDFDTSLIFRLKGGLNAAAILSEKTGARQVISCKAQSKPEELPSAVSQYYPKVLLFDGHLPVLSLKLMHQFPDAITVLDAGSVHEGTELLAAEVDWLITSAKYARTKSELKNLNDALNVLTLLNQKAVITDGGNGCIWSIDGELGKTPATEVKALDSNGAGDVFHGAFAFGIVKGLSPKDNLQYASQIAAKSCTVKGINL
jgi:sulfofructose kinase